ncbi:hypothetical protein OROHE_015744 [Orobanche hederae]
MAVDRWALLGRLKINILLDFNANRWKLASIIGASASSKRRLSFNNNKQPGLMACVEDSGSDYDPRSAAARSFRRTISCPSEEDDIDKRADAFIANFHKQLKFERQISLELRYYKGNTFGTAKST